MCVGLNAFFVDVHVLLPVAVVGCTVTRVSLELIGDRGNPDGREAHSLDVVQLKRQSVRYRNEGERRFYVVLDTLPCTAAIFLSVISFTVQRVVSLGDENILSC